MVDLSFLKTFTKGNSDKIARYITMYLEAAPAAFSEMQAALSQKDWMTLATQAHGLKPQAEFMGITGLKEVLIDIEHKGKAGEGEGMQGLLQQALSLHEAAVPVLEKEVLG